MNDEQAAPEAADEAEWICTKCGESNPADFGLCWKCQASAPEPPADAGYRSAGADTGISTSLRRMNHGVNGGL